jgi:hypothetical protein
MHKIISCPTADPLLSIVKEKVLKELYTRYPNYPAITMLIEKVLTGLKIILDDNRNREFALELQDKSKQRRHIADLKKALLEQIDPLIRDTGSGQAPVAFKEVITQVKLHFRMKKPRLSQDDKSIVNDCISKLQTIVIPHHDMQIDQHRTKQKIIETIEAILCETKTRKTEASRTTTQFSLNVSKQLVVNQINRQLEKQALVQKTLKESIKREQEFLLFETQFSDALRNQHPKPRIPSDLVLRLDQAQQTVSQLTQRIKDAEIISESNIQKIEKMRDENQRLMLLMDTNTKNLKKLKAAQHTKETKLQQVFVQCEAEKKHLQDEIDRAIADMKDTPIQFKKDSTEQREAFIKTIEKELSTMAKTFNTSYKESSDAIVAQWDKFRTQYGHLRTAFSDRYTEEQRARRAQSL